MGIEDDAFDDFRCRNLESAEKPSSVMERQRLVKRAENTSSFYPLVK